AWFGGESGQVGNEAAIVVQSQCRSKARLFNFLSSRLALQSGTLSVYPSGLWLFCMTYLVLARKWRPRSFDTLIGQDHVVRALTHALSTQRLHHAWLFTGTRGVGKT